MGDIRNKIAKIERAASEQKAFESFLRSGAPLLDAAPVRRNVSDERLDLELLYQPLPGTKKPRSVSRRGC